MRCVLSNFAATLELSCFSTERYFERVYHRQLFDTDENQCSLSGLERSLHIVMNAYKVEVPLLHHLIRLHESVVSNRPNRHQDLLMVDVDYNDEAPFAFLCSHSPFSI